MVAPESDQQAAVALGGRAATVITGPPVDPVDRFRDLPLPAWERRGEYQDITVDVAEGMAKLTIARPEVATPSGPRPSSSWPMPSPRPGMTPQWVWSS